MLYGAHRNVPFFTLQRDPALIREISVLELSAKISHYQSVLLTLYLSSLIISDVLFADIGGLSSRLLLLSIRWHSMHSMASCYSP